MSKSAEEVSFRPALRGKWQQSPQTMQTIPPAAARVEMEQEEPERARPTKLTCGLLLHKLRVHCLLVTLLVTTLLLTLAWLACAVGGIVRSDLGNNELFALPYYYQAVATGLALLVAVSATTTVIVGMNGLARLQQAERFVTIASRRPSKMVYDTVNGKTLKGMSTTKLRSFSCGTVGLIFLGILLALLAVTIAFWSITLAYNIDILIQVTPLKSIPVATVVAPVICIEVMLGLVVPLLLMLSVVPINSVLRFITYDRVDIRKIMPKLLPFVKFAEGEKYNYWVAIGTFFFQIKDDYTQTHEELHKRKWYHLCDTTKSTIVIFFILAVNFLLAWTVFVNGTLIHEFNAQSCRELSNSERERAICIKLGNISVVNCTSPESSSIDAPLTCFEFLQFSEQADILQSLTGAVVLYFIAEKFITLMLEMIRFFYLFHKSRIWAILVILAGVAVIGGDIVLILASLVWNLASFDLVRIFQYLIIGTDIILVGMLLLISKPLELVSKFHLKQESEMFDEIETSLVNDVYMEEQNRKSETENEQSMNGTTEPGNKPLQ